MQLTFEKNEVILKFSKDLLSDGYVQDFFQRLKSEMIVRKSGLSEEHLRKSWLGCMKGTGGITGDIMSPAEDTNAWEVLSK